MVPWIESPTLDFDLDLPPAERYLAIKGKPLELGRELLSAVMAQVPPLMKPIADLARLRTAGRFTNEMKAIAARVETSWRDVMLGNLSYDLTLLSMACSTMALATSEGPVLARNMDFWPEGLLARASYLMRYRRGGKTEYISAGWPGAVGIVTGYSARDTGRFAVALNAVMGPEKSSRTGYPVLLHIRRVVEDAKDFEDAVDMLSSQHIALPTLFTVVGMENHQRVVIERSPKRYAIRKAEGDKPLMTTNDYRLLYSAGTTGEHEMYGSTCMRYDSLCRFTAELSPDKPVADEALLYMLTDPGVQQEITAQHIIIRPGQDSMRCWVPRRLAPGVMLE